MGAVNVATVFANNCATIENSSRPTEDEIDRTFDQTIAVILVTFSHHEDKAYPENPRKPTVNKRNTVAINANGGRPAQQGLKNFRNVIFSA